MDSELLARVHMCKALLGHFEKLKEDTAYFHDPYGMHARIFGTVKDRLTNELNEARIALAEVRGE